MIDNLTAIKILGASVTNFIDRNGTITKANLEAEVINNICLYILKSQREKALGQTTIHDMFISILKNAQENSSVDITKVFTDAARELFHNHYTVKEAINATFGVQENLAWEGMWDFLKKYFIEKHGLNIEEN